MKVRKAAKEVSEGNMRVVSYKICMLKPNIKRNFSESDFFKITWVVFEWG